MEGILAILFLFGTPAIIVVLLVISSMWKQHLQSKERIMQMKVEQSNIPNESLMRMMEELRKEVAQLRDTTTQYDMSIDKNMHMIEQRLSYLEQKSFSQTASQYEQQRIG